MFFNAVTGGRWLSSRLVLAVGLLGAAFSMSGCVAAAVVGVAGTGALVAQDRSIGEGIDDIATDGEIKSELLREGGGLNQVNVAVNEGHVLLTGNVPYAEDRVKAAKIAWSTPHVETVVNEIEVNGSSEIKRIPGDTWLSTRVRTALMFQKGVKNLNYGVETVNGTVYLFGTARNQEELQRATDRVRRVSGVRRVVSHVRLKTPPPAIAAPAPVTIGQL